MILVILLIMHKNRGCDYLFYDYFDFLCKQKGVSPNKACQEMGISRSVAAKWKSTNTKPRMDTLVKISEYFNISTDELVSKSENIAQEENKKTATDDGDGLTDVQKEFLSVFYSLTDQDVSVLLSAAKAQLEAHKSQDD